MKYLIILCDGMSDRRVAELGYRTPLEASHTPAMDRLARDGVTGMIRTIPRGATAGSEVANSVILGYDPTLTPPGRGPLEAIGMGVATDPWDLIVRCNIISLTPTGKILSHNAGDISEESLTLLSQNLERIGVKMLGGNGFRQLISIPGGSASVTCRAPHDHIGQPIDELRPKASAREGKMTARLLREIIDISEKILSTPTHRRALWPWGPGVRPTLSLLSLMYPTLVRSAMISAVPLIKGLGRLAGMEVIEVTGATGGTDTDYAAKAEAALRALEDHELVYLHIEAPDEVSHSRDVAAKMSVIEAIDSRIVSRIFTELSTRAEEKDDICVAILPDHPTYVETGAHGDAEVPVAVWYRGIEPDCTDAYSEERCATGALGHMDGRMFLKKLINLYGD